ncbi:uncharacterized protein F4807DRAFT_442600 [Annulohypoxylon truncatum]|uniref:uncharacterized protein n=1 Tax=Annulohypoxylon truncatum TaxID=327061 RepID=UPI0020076818|nr:uncharacterized protein F4807DRAFT_442600 [Annulohypoxylon truncatum]KAI1205654.1 hypothetical protein F4807DRAFT_442600 [Annulohypoxylon truncatum]
MSSFSGKKIFSHARSKLTKSRKLRDIISKLSIKRLTHQPSSLVDNDDLSSIGNPTSSTGLGITLTNNSRNTVAQDVESRNVIVLSSGQQTEKKVSGLLLLPQELFDHITSYLGAANVAVLALVNKELMYRFMTSCMKTGITEPYEPVSYRVLNKFIEKTDASKTKIRGTLLSLIDYDLEDLVYCYKCKRIHDPFLPFIDRAYAPHKAARCADWSMDHHMPPRATRKLLRTISKRRLHGAPYRHLLQQVNNTQTTYHKGILVQVTLRARYRNSDLILRRQQVVSSVDKSALSLWLFGQMIKDPPRTGLSFLSLPKTYPMCNHGNWGSVYQPLIQQLVNPLCKNDHIRQNITRHEVACFSKEPLDVSKQEGHIICERLKWVVSGARHNPTDVHPLLGEVLGCANCTTDFSIDVVPLPEPFNWGFVLTSWIDLGRIDFCSQWDSHRDVRPGREVRRHVHGDICEAFEDLPSRLDYRPKISSVDGLRMANYVWGERAKVGLDKYINWTQGHTCNPATGWYEDPDPLEDADC